LCLPGGEGKWPPSILDGWIQSQFAPFSRKVKELFAGRQEPMVVNIRVNAGYIPREHWVQRDLRGGGRIVGELCHFVDWARFVVGASIMSVTGHAIPGGARYNRDNVVSAMAFQDGSIANVLNLANGDRSVSKEMYEVFCEGKVERIDDFRRSRTGPRWGIQANQ